MPEDTNLDKARRYPQAIEKGNAAYVLSLRSPEAYIDQLPNKIYPQGSRARVFQIPEAFEKTANFLPTRSTRSLTTSRMAIPLSSRL
jgi:hypothetical protein